MTCTTIYTYVTGAFLRKFQCLSGENRHFFRKNKQSFCTYFKFACPFLVSEIRKQHFPNNHFYLLSVIQSCAFICLSVIEVLSPQCKQYFVPISSQPNNNKKEFGIMKCDGQLNESDMINMPYVHAIANIWYWHITKLDEYRTKKKDDRQAQGQTFNSISSFWLHRIYEYGYNRYEHYIHVNMCCFRVAFLFCASIILHVWYSLYSRKHRAAQKNVLIDFYFRKKKHRGIECPGFHIIVMKGSSSNRWSWVHSTCVFLRWRSASFDRYNIINSSIYYLSLVLFVIIADITHI